MKHSSHLSSPLVLGLIVLFAVLALASLLPVVPADAAPRTGVYKLIGWNDLGMHCMNESFQDMAVLPPFNTVWAQLILQGPQPQIVTTAITVEYNIVGNTYSVGKTNFWTYAPQLFPGSPSATQPEVGLAGARVAGVMTPSPNHFTVVGIPLTPYLDSAPTPGPANWYPYQRAHLVAKDQTTGSILAETTTVAPVSTEMNCALCHSDGQRNGIATGVIEQNILTLHDQLQSTTLMAARPVLCANCHGSNALGMAGAPGVPNLSLSMHGKHASATSDCYNCHPGQQTRCLRDIMWSEGLTCVNCHGGMTQVANPARQPWIDLPRCENCHDAQYAVNTGKRYRDSVGHGGLYCEACHGSPHAILPTIQQNDNVQNIALQGHPGTLSECTVCHGMEPAGAGPHNLTSGTSYLYFPYMQR